MTTKKNSDIPDFLFQKDRHKASDFTEILKIKDKNYFLSLWEGWIKLSNARRRYFLLKILRWGSENLATPTIKTINQLFSTKKYYKPE